LATAAFALACGSQASPSTNRPLPFTPSNVDLATFDLSGIGDVDLSGTNCVLDGEQPDGLVAMLCDRDFTNKVAHRIVTLPDQTQISVFVLRSLRIEASTVLQLNRGRIPIILVATRTVEIAGAIEVGPGTTGGPSNASKYSPGRGEGGGTAGDATGLAGGGGSSCGLGGRAGTTTATPGNPASPPTPPYGNPELIPLRGGSAGGSGALINDIGAGGGAFEVVAGSSIHLAQGAFINVGGGGGGFGGLGMDGAGGGGSGGSLLLEAPEVAIAGAIGANGGGGGQGNGDQGESGKPDSVARGGQKPAVGDTGANGSYGAAINGSNGPTSASGLASGGGGGGGAGRIRINTSNGIATITGAISPALGTGCATQGTLAK
jgi:hypothetical protein